MLLRLDYCNAVLAGLPATTLAPLQRILHAAARLVVNLRPREHVTSALLELHWLSVPRRIKLCLLLHNTQLGCSSRYLSDLLNLAADVPGRPSVRSSSRSDFILPRTSALLFPEPGTYYQWNLRRLPTFHTTAQAQTENFFYYLLLSCKLNYVMRPQLPVGVGGALEILL